MGKLQTFSIVLANAGVYYAGQVVQGHVILSLNEPLKMRGMTYLQNLCNF